MQKINNPLSFSFKAFLRILQKKAFSFSDLDDSLVSSDLNEFMATKEDREKLMKLLMHYHEGNTSLEDGEVSEEKSYNATFSNGRELSIK